MGSDYIVSHGSGHTPAEAGAVWPTHDAPSFDLSGHSVEWKPTEAAVLPPPTSVLSTEPADFWRTS